MPTHSLLPFVESPDGLAQDSLISNSASIPGPGSSMTPHATYPEKAVSQPGGGGSSVLLSCMFCDETFAHQDELGPHVLTQHPTTFFEPAVLRVEAEFRIPGERPRPKPGGLPSEKEEVHSCIVCGQVSQDPGELEAHMRKHKDYFTYCCNVCGRRFREPWFLKNHMKMHVKPGAKGKAQQDPESPATVNDVVQDPVAEPVVTVYKMCMVCGFFFPDHDALAEHSKVHNREAENQEDPGPAEPPAKEIFLQSLGLLPRSEGNAVRSSKWIPQLDPFNTYQSWQLATKGKIAVGPNNTKDLGQEASTDNEDCGSDKEELNGVWSEGQGDKALKEGVRSQQQTAVDLPDPQHRRSLMQKNKSKERPTTCEDCQRTFRTYHQLVLHSRVHKRERGGGAGGGGGGEESPTPSVEGKLARVGPLDPAEEGSEEGYEEAAMAENLGPGEDGFDRSKVRSKACSYCGKSFRSSYYLTVHLRTHTGEKPFKCAYCNYAAAQKTSLKYHLDRRHKDKPYVDIPSRPVPSDEKPGNDGETPNRSKLWVPAVRPCTPEDRFDGDFVKAEKLTDELEAPVKQLKTEREEIKEEIAEAPLNLSLKVSLSIAAGNEPRNALLHIACSFCAYKTIYPEVLIMHKKLSHKDKSDGVKRNGFGGGGGLKQKRYTGCPPALEGKDVAPLPTIDRRHPRRTKSPTPQPAVKPPEKPAVHPPKTSPVQDVQETQRYRQNADQHQESSRFTELMRKSGGKYTMDRPDRVGLGPARAGGGVIWHPDAARLCLSSSRFGNLPQIDFGEPTTKRLKFSLGDGGGGGSGGAAERSGFRGPAGDASTRLLVPGRKATSQGGSGPSAASEALGSVKNAAAAMGGLDSDWSMMNLLRSYSPSDLASLYHTAPPNPGLGGLANPRPGGRTVLYQHLPTLPNLQRRDPSCPFPPQRYGTTDKSS